MKFFLFITCMGWLACQQSTEPRAIPFHYSASTAQQVLAYLESKVAVRGFGGAPACAVTFLGADSTALYLLYYCQEFYVSNGNRQEGTGEAGPIALYYKKVDSAVMLTGHRKPRDGNLYAKDLDAYFPSWAQQQIRKHEKAYQTMHQLIVK